MTAPTTIELTRLLSPEKLERLQAEAEYQQTPLSELVREVIETYLDELDDEDEAVYEDTPDEKILADIREAMIEALAGRTRPAREVLEEVRRELGQEHDDDQG